MYHGSYPPVAIAAALDHTNTAVRHPNAPFEIIVTVIRQINAVQHFPLVAVNVLIAHAADIVHLRHRRTAVLVRASVPGELVHETVYETVRNAAVHTGSFFVSDGVPHAPCRRAARRAGVRVLPRSALFLSVPASVPGVEEVGNAGVHQRVYLLHATLNTVIMKVRPSHARSRAAAGYRCTQLGTDDRRADYGTEMLVVRHPLRLHVLYPCAIT